MQPRNALLSEYYRQQMKQLPAFYQTIHRVWRTLGGGVVNGDVLSLNASSDIPLPLDQISSRNTYALLQARHTKEPHCIQKYLPIYGQLHWSQTWRQLHICDLDRKVIDLNWQIAHGVLYTGARLAHSFGMRHIESAFVELMTRLSSICSSNASWLASWLHGYTPTQTQSTQPQVGLPLRSYYLGFRRHDVEQSQQPPPTCCWLSNTPSGLLVVTSDFVRRRR